MISLFILLGLHMLGLGNALSRHGEDRKGKYNFFISLVAFSIHLYLYYKVGVFNIL